MITFIEVMDLIVKMKNEKLNMVVNNCQDLGLILKGYTLHALYFVDGRILLVKTAMKWYWLRFVNGYEKRELEVNVNKTIICTVWQFTVSYTHLHLLSSEVIFW